jgi:type VI protein secretion system component VasF
MSTAKTPKNGLPASTDQLTDEIGRTRQQLGDAVQQLAAKTDVKQQLAKQAGQVRDTATRKAKETARQLGSDDRLPVVVSAAAAGVFAVIAFVLLMRWRADR